MATNISNNLKSSLKVSLSAAQRKLLKQRLQGIQKPETGGLPDQSGGLRNQSIPVLNQIARTGSLPLSFAQQRLWLLEQMAEVRGAYHIPSPLRLQGLLDVPALERSFTEIIERHEALRTVFPMDGDAPIQLIQPSGDFSLPVIDLEALSPADQDTAIRKCSLENRGQPFDLATGPLMRVNLLRLA